MNNLVIPPSPNWYENKILACTADNTLIYGSRNELVIIKSHSFDKPADIKIVPHAHFERVTSVDVSPNWSNDMSIVSSGGDRIVKLWSLRDYSCSCNHVHSTISDKLVGAVFAGNDKIVAVSENGFISVWRTVTDKTTPFKNLFSFKVQITALASCPHAPWLTAFGLKCGLVILADLRRNGKILYKMRGHDKSIVSLNWCPVPYNVFPKKVLRTKIEIHEISDENVIDIGESENANSKISPNREIKENCSQHEIQASEINDDLNEINDKQEDSVPSVEMKDNTNLEENQINKVIEVDAPTLQASLDIKNNTNSIKMETSLDGKENVNAIKTDTSEISKDIKTNENDMNLIEDELIKDNLIKVDDEKQKESFLSSEIKDETNLENNKMITLQTSLDAKENTNAIKMETSEISEDIKTSENIKNKENKILIENQGINKISDEPVLEDNLENLSEIKLDTGNISENTIHLSVEVDQLKLEDEVICISDSNDEDLETNQSTKEYLLASSARGGPICIWRAGTDGRKEVELYMSSNKNKRNYRGSDKTWIALCWLAPHILLSSTGSGELLQWDLLSLNKTRNVPQKKLVHHDHRSTLFAIVAPIELNPKFEPDGWRNKKNLFAWTVGQERFLLCTSLQADRTTHVSYPTNAGFIYCLASSPLDPNRIAVGIGDNTAKIWDLSRPHVQCIVMTNLWQKIQSKVLTLAWHPTKETILAYGTLEGRIGLINSNNSSKTPSLLCQYFRTAVYQLTWGPLNGNTEKVGLYACGEKQIAIYDADNPTDEPKIMKVGNNEQVTCMAWKSDYTFCIIGTKGGSLWIYDTNLEHKTTIYTQHKTIYSILWHPEATAEDNEISPFNFWFAVSNADASVIVYDLAKENGSGDNVQEDHRIVAILTGHSKAVKCLCWSSYEGAKLVSGGEDGVAQVWDVKTATIISTFVGHNLEAVICVLWSPLNKDFIITGGKDNCIRIWNINENQPMTEEDLVRVYKERAKLNKEVKKHKKAGLSDDEEENVKVKRGAILNLIARAQNNIETLLKDSKRILSLHNNEKLKEIQDGETVDGNAFDVCKLFGDKDNMMELLEIEQERHVEKKKFLFNQHISLWKGDFAETLKESINDGTVNPWLINMAPMVSPKLWQEACVVYATKLLEDVKSDPIETVSYLLACHKVEEAINVLCNATLYREALVLAKCRLPKSDPVINDVLRKWSTFAVLNGTYELAAQCFIALGEYEEAAKALFKRTDVRALEFAVELAEKSGNNDLKAAVTQRYNSFKFYAANKNGVGSEVETITEDGVDKSSKASDKPDTEHFVDNTNLQCTSQGISSTDNGDEAISEPAIV